MNTGTGATRTIDLNADVGELPARLADGSEAALMAEVSSVNIACGGHAGDAGSMTAVVRLARACKLTIGAHPSYPDREGFGRRSLGISPDALADAIAAQVAALDRIVRAEGERLEHVKPHGSLYNVAADDEAVAAAIARGVARVSRTLRLVGLAGSRCLEVWRDAGFATAAEGFADRRYEPGGRLRARSLAGALLTDPAQVAAQAVEIARHGRALTERGDVVVVSADTLCIHGDTPGAVALVRALRAGLSTAGVSVAALAASPPQP